MKTLFAFGKKKEETMTNAPDGVCKIKVLGAGCKSCHELYENVKKAVEETGLKADVDYITNMPKIMEYGVMSLPALVVNGKVVSMGRMLKARDIKALLEKHK